MSVDGGTDTFEAVHLIDTEAEELTAIARNAQKSLSHIAEMLLAKIDRATLFEAEMIAVNVVTMRSVVNLIAEADGEREVVQIVYPREADISAKKISVMTPAGADLIGMQEGHRVIWPDHKRQNRQLVIEMVQQPAAH